MEKEFYFLILAHHKPYQLEQLVLALLKYNNIGIGIHLDKKANLGDFFFLKNINPDLYFVQKRVSINWGGYSMVKATIESISEISTICSFKSLILLSGQCLPTNDLKLFFERLRVLNYSYIHLSTTYGSTECNVTYDYHFHDFTIFSTLSDYTAKVIRYFNLPQLRRFNPFYLFTRLVNKNFKRTTLPLSMTPYYGIQWWALSWSFLKVFLVIYNENKKSIDSYYKYSNCPDEWFFHTFFKNFAIDYPLWNNFNYPLISYSDMSLGNGHPKILNQKYHKKIIESESPFCRKFDFKKYDYNPTTIL